MAEELTWRRFRVKVKRFKGWFHAESFFPFLRFVECYTYTILVLSETHETAKEYLKGILNHSSNYETETSFGKGQRKRKTKKLTDSESDEPQKKIIKKRPIPAPPALKNVTHPTKQKVSISLEHQKNRKEVVRIKKHAAKVAQADVKTDSSRKRLLEKLRQPNSSVTLSKGSGYANFL